MVYIHNMNLNNIDLNSLRCLVVLVEEASVSKTASRLEMSQPAISHCLKRLREIFNDPLLVRVGSKMSVTPRGASVAQEAKYILEKIGHLVQPPQVFNPTSYDGNFVISSPEYVDYRLTPILTKTVLQTAPKAHLLIRPPPRIKTLNRGNWIYASVGSTKFARTCAPRCSIQKSLSA